MELAPLVPPPSYSFVFLNLSTLALFYAKIEVDLFIAWWIVFAPSLLFCAYKLLTSIYQLGSLQERAANAINSQQLRLFTVWKLTQMLIFFSLIVFLFFLSEFLERLDRHDKSALESFKHIAAVLAFVFVLYFGYSWAAKNILDDALLLPLSSSSFNGQNDLNNYKENSKQEEAGLSQQIINGVFTLMGNTMTICAGGQCNSFYISTFSAFFGAFGIPLFEYLHYLNFIAFILMGVSLFSLYSAKKSFLYIPFLMSLVGTSLVLTDMLVYDLDYFTYLGNILIMASAIYNSRLNKRRFGKKV